MADVIHIGTATTLAAVPIADCSDTDIAYIWLNSRQVKMVFSSAATNATAIADGQTTPYYIRPTDYGAGPGVWVEDVGDLENIRLNGGQIITGGLQSTNWAAAAGSKYDLDNAWLKLGGENVTAAGAIAGVFIGEDSGAYKVYVGDGSTKYFKFDATDFVLNLANLVINSSTQTIKLGTGNDIITLDAADATYRLAIGHATYASAPFRVTKAGVLTATGATITGSITSTSGTIGGWVIGANSLTSTLIGLHSAGYAEGAEILLGHATAYASALIGLKADGSGKLASGNISWTAAGLLTAEFEDGGSITLDAGADIILTGDDSDPGIITFNGTTYSVSIGSDTSGQYFEFSPSVDDTVKLFLGSAGYGAFPFARYTAIYLNAAEDIVLYSGDSGGNPTAAAIYVTESRVQLQTRQEPDDHNFLLNFENDGANGGSFYPIIDSGSSATGIDLGDDGSTTCWRNFYLKGHITFGNITHEDTDYGRESELIFKGEQSGGEQTTLAKIQVAHDGTSDDQKGILTIKINDGDDGDSPTDRVTIDSAGNVGIKTTSPSAYADLTLYGGALCIKETTTPTADADYGKIYTKNDNKIYFQDGAGTEHEIAFV